MSSWEVNQASLLCGMRRVLSMLSRFPFFDHYRMRSAYYIFKTILREREKENQSQSVRGNIAAANTTMDGEEDLPEDSITLRDAFELVPKVVEMLVDVGVFASFSLKNFYLSCEV
jgi:hypothetical protein